MKKDFSTIWKCQKIGRIVLGLGTSSSNNPTNVCDDITRQAMRDNLIPLLESPRCMLNSPEVLDARLKSIKL